MRVPFIVYADFESLTPQLSTRQPNPDNSYTNQYHKHIPSGFCYHTKCFDDTPYCQEPVTFVKEFDDHDAAQIFIDKLEKNIKDIYKKFKFQNRMAMTMQDKLVYDNSTLCHICNEETGSDDDETASSGDMVSSSKGDGTCSNGASIFSIGDGI